MHVKSLRVYDCKKKMTDSDCVRELRCKFSLSLAHARYSFYAVSLDTSEKSSQAKKETMATEKEYRAWASDKENLLMDLGVELEEATETHLQLMVNGGKLHILIPSAYGTSVDGDSSEIFLVLTMGDAEGKVESAMMALNEKLDKIRVKPKALSQVLDLLFAALKKLNLGPKRRKCEDHMEMASDWEGEDEEDEEDEDEDEACQNSEEEYESDPGDMAGYDIAVGDPGASGRMAGIRERGCLHALAESARKECENYQTGASRDVQNPYMWFRVVSKPMLLTVQIQLEVAGMIDDRIAAGLGLTFKEPVLLNLEFSKNLWAETSFRKEKYFRYERVTASQNPLPSSVVMEQTQMDDIDRFLETSGSGDKHRSYGLEVLFPELTARFFAHLNQDATGEVVHLDGFENVKLDSTNPFVRLAHYISFKLKLLPGWCLVCWKKLPSAITRMRTCDEDLCLYRFEELGLGVSVLDEVQNNPELVEMELSLAFSAVESSRDVFEPFPGFLLVENQIRGRSGWFSNKAMERGQKNDSPGDTARAAAPQTGRANKHCVVLKEVISSIPGVQTLGRCTSEQALKKAMTRAWFLFKQKQKRAFNAPPPSLPPSWESEEEAEAWKRDSQLPYNVARFILMTNRLSLQLLSPADQIIKLGKSAPGESEDKSDPEWTIYQFVVLHDTPEREAYFSLQREQHGSYFAFHGSGAENWYSILRNGLRSMSNTNYMSTGAAYGEGIYLASHLDTSMLYARSVGCSWPGGKLMNGYQCLAVCEVINNSHRLSPPSTQNLLGRSPSPTILVVPRENERNVAIRYFMVFKPNATKAMVYETGTYPFEIQGLHFIGEPKINLLEHFQRLRNAQKEALEAQNRTRMKERSEIFLAALPQPPPPPPASSTKSKVTTKPVKAPTMTTRAASGAGSRAVMQELNNLTKAIRNSPPIASCVEKGEPAPVLSGTGVSLPDEEGNLSLWRIEIHPYLLKEGKNLYNDFLELKRLLNRQEDVPVVLEVKFPATFPFAPPFVRVLSPRFRSQTGHVTVGGSICMELLTASGWSPACNFESMLVQVVMAFVEGDGRLDLKVSAHGREYQEGEAREAFLRAANAHGWKTS